MSSMKFLLFLACLAFAQSSSVFHEKDFIQDQQSFPYSTMKGKAAGMRPMPMLSGFPDRRGFSPENLHVESVAEMWIIDLCDRASGRCFKLNIRQVPKADYHVDF